ncbi:MAG: ferredoxin III, nif-specific [Magnetococcales bacterium]|nr:ferredoxin III, nif-specific [Magnetococcales bacterium]NGZ25917.1 ferredoxin III, nif-specific [Magnetococcales bacterium]
MATTMLTSLTRGGTPWTPTFLTTLEGRKCIGCGRCFKVCPRDVFDLVERESIDSDDDEEDWDDDGFSDDPHMVMMIKNGDDCIGCAACSRVCPKNCHHHAPWPVKP